MFCPICGKPIIGVPSDMLPDMALCESCAANIRDFVKGTSEAEREAALQYILKYCRNTQDSALMNAIVSLLHNQKRESAADEKSQAAQSSRKFHDAGKKMMAVSENICLLGIFGSVILGLALVFLGFDSRDGATLVICGIAVEIVGSALSWIGSLIIYGFGELVNNSQIQTELALKNSSQEE